MTQANEGTPLLAEEGGSGALTNSFRRKSVVERISTRGSINVREVLNTREVQPVDGLSPLVSGGVITTIDGYTTCKRPVSTVKSLPAFVPFRRYQRHRSYYLWWINQFRHWWKSSRLLVRLAGLFTLAFTGIFLLQMLRVTPYFPFPTMPAGRRAKKQVLKAFSKEMAKNTRRAVKVVKKLGQGGPMKFFLNYVKPFTRSLRLLVAGWRWTEAAQCRRGEVGTEEAFAFMGNRVSRMLARLLVDSAVAFCVLPLAYWIFRIGFIADDRGTERDWWHPVTLFIVLGVLRAVAPYAASFQGSRAGRVLTRTFFRAALCRWQPIQAVHQLKLTSDDACEKDEVSQTADLVQIGKSVAKAFGKAKDIGTDGMEGQREALEKEGFRQVGAGSGGYAVYECHRRLWSRRTHDGDGEEEVEELMSILLHVTPYGPSILDVMPRYVVLEFEDSVDRRAKWSEFISKSVFEGPPVVEGYCYGGAFFSPHHFAELKATYDKQLLAYDRGCKSLCKSRTRQQNPPIDLRSLKEFLANGKMGGKRRRNAREARELQRGVHRVAQELKTMMANKDSAPRGVILYFEGLDCAGKSSTGGLVEQALVEAGYNVGMRQYNRPPTEAQKLRPWMDRFEVPETGITTLFIPDGAEDGQGNGGDVPLLVMPHNALVWDRGPSGDFVYNPTYLAMTWEEREERYQEFLEFDRQCCEKNILFLKLLFVTNRDSIASTLGKRLAQKKMARDLRTWHKASFGAAHLDDKNLFEGLDMIEHHIDPTDFIAFNRYQTNLRIFANFARNTDSLENPWIVVNTGDRYAARKALLAAFRRKLDRFKDKGCCERRDEAAQQRPPLKLTPVGEADTIDLGYSRPLPIQLLVALAGLMLVAFYYAEHTTFRNPFLDTWIDIEKLLPKDETTASGGNLTEILYPLFEVEDLSGWL